MNKFTTTVSALALILAATGCENDDPKVILPDYQDVKEATADGGNMARLYVLNEGNMGANKATIDFLDYAKGFYCRNTYPENNPTVALELGDTGTDLQINGQRMYAVINQSHKVEVMDAATSVRIGQVNIDNPRYIVFDSENAYVSSYVGGEGESGSVVRFSLSTLEVTGKVSVGLSPEEMVISGGKLYVANSALFKGNETTFDNTVSIIDLASFSKTGSIEVDVNLHHLKADGNGNLWANSRGNYGNIPARLHKLGRGTDGSYTVTASYDVPCTNFTIADNKLYYYATVYDASWNAVLSYGTIDTASGNDLGSFITDGTDADIATPYAIAIHPDTGDIYLTDAKNYVSSGSLYCYSKDGKRKWAVKTGDVPGHLAFLKK